MTAFCNQTNQLFIITRLHTTTMRPPSLALLRALRSSSLHHSEPLLCSKHHKSISKALRPGHHRTLTTGSHNHASQASTPSTAPRSTDRGPASTETTQTDFGAMDVFSHTPAPSASIDACLSDGFHLDNGVKITGGSGLLLVGGEAFAWRPWETNGGRGRLLNRRGQWDTGEGEGGTGDSGGAWGLLEVVWPKPGEWRWKGNREVFDGIAELMCVQNFSSWAWDH